MVPRISSLNVGSPTARLPITRLMMINIASLAPTISHPQRLPRQVYLQDHLPSPPLNEPPRHPPAFFPLGEHPRDYSSLQTRPRYNLRHYPRLEYHSVDFPHQITSGITPDWNIPLCPFPHQLASKITSTFLSPSQIPPPPPSPRLGDSSGDTSEDHLPFPSHQNYFSPPSGYSSRDYFENLPLDDYVED